MLRNLMMLGIFSFLFGCGSEDGKPGMFSPMGYHVGKTKVWLKSPGGGMEMYKVNEVEGADPATFRPRTLVNKSGDTATVGFDAHSVFWYSSQIKGADPASFEFVAGQYSKDKKAAYYQHYFLTDDVAHFESVGPYMRDSKNIYFAGEPFSDDAPHFERVGDESSQYYRDSKQCWHYISLIKGADPATLRHLGGNYAADARHVYFEMCQMDGADSRSFKILERGFSADAGHVFFKCLPIEGADPASFRILNDDYSADKQQCYFMGYPLPGADPKSLVIIDKFYAKDAKHVWINGKPIEGADPATFEVENGSAGKSRDAKHRYDLDKRI